MPELEAQNLSLGRKFYLEYDVQVENCQFQRPEAKPHENEPQKCRNRFFYFLIFWGGSGDEIHTAFDEESEAEVKKCQMLVPGREN